MSNRLFYGAMATAKQVTLLKAERIARMLDCDTADEAFKLAQEGGFGGASTTIDQAIAYERKALSEFMLNECPSDRLKKYLLARFDFLNCEVAVKAKHLGFDAKSMMVDYGFFSADVKMKDHIRKKNNTSHCNHGHCNNFRLLFFLRHILSPPV